MENEKQELHTEKIRVGRRTYFFDIKANKNGDRYLVITESKSTLMNGFRRDRIMIFEEHIDEFKDTFEKILEYLNSTEPEKKTEVLEPSTF